MFHDLFEDYMYLGIFADSENHAPVLWFSTSRSRDEMLSFKVCIRRMSQGQKERYSLHENCKDMYDQYDNTSFSWEVIFINDVD